MPALGQRNPLLDPKRNTAFWALVDALCQRREITRSHLWKKLHVSSTDRYKLKTGELWFGQRLKLLSKMVELLRATGDERRKLYALNNIDVDGMDATSSPYADLVERLNLNHREILTGLKQLADATEDPRLASLLAAAIRAGTRAASSLEDKIKFQGEMLEVLAQSDRTEVRQIRADLYGSRAATRGLEVDARQKREGRRATEPELAEIINDAKQAFVLWAEWPARRPTVPFKLVYLTLTMALREQGLSYADRVRDINPLVAPFGLAHEESGRDLDHPLPIPSPGDPPPTFKIYVVTDQAPPGSKERLIQTLMESNPDAIRPRKSG